MTTLLHITHPALDLQTIDPRSTLISGRLPEKLPDVAHTSLGDLHAGDIIDLAAKYHELQFHDQFFDIDSDIFQETQLLLNFLQHRNIIKNFKKPSPVEFYQNTGYHHKDPCLWVFGCSHSYGVGLEPLQRYGQLLADRLGLPLILVAEPGSSLTWSLDQIHRSDIKESDLVIWQITTPYRKLKFDVSPKHVMLSSRASHCYLEVFTNQQVFFDHVSMIRQGINYLRSKHIRFAMTSLDSKDYYYQYLKEYTRYPEYCYTPEIWKDRASDGLHPGPLSNSALADRLFIHLQLDIHTKTTT
jgi:hypothetical protein